MNFVELGPINPFSLVFLGLGVALFLFGLWLGPRTENSFVAFLAMVVALVGVVGFALGMSSISGIPQTAQRIEVGEQIEESYGLELSHEELTELDYPVAEPEGDFEVFGSIFRDQRTEDGFERTEIFLIWRDGEMALAGSPDGETFIELQR